MKFEDLHAWQKARQLTNSIYRLGQNSPLNKDFGLKDQLQRAAVSVMSNIAEGFDRTHMAEKIQFWNVAKGSAGEAKSLLYVIPDNHPLLEESAKASQVLSSEASALIQGLINSFGKSRRSPGR
jgi:four helix bundle protein